MELDNVDLESERLNDLNSYSIMDSAAEVSFDQLAQLASSVCKTPIALISFIGPERQWIKSSVGINIHEIPRHLSACNSTIEQFDYCEIQDINNIGQKPFVEFMKQEGLRYYAGVPITTQQGHNIGSLCVIDYVPRKLKTGQLDSLRLISEQIRKLLEIRKHYKINLQKLHELKNKGYENDKKLRDIIHKSSMRGMAELSAGLSYRIKTQATIIENARKRLSNLENIPASAADLKYQLNILKMSVDNIFHVINSLDKFILAEQEKWMRPVQMNEVIQNVVDHLEHKLKKYKIELHLNLELDVICIGNLTQLTEAVFAVLNNAIEAVELMPMPQIEISMEKDNHIATILIKDWGHGVAEIIKPYIYQPFFTTKGELGVGTGLSLAEAIMHYHSGDIELISDNSPTIFKLCLPVP